MMNTTTNNTNTINQNAFNYAMYMMLGSYFNEMSAASEYYIEKMYLYYAEQKKDKQYMLEDIVLDFAEHVLKHELPEDIWQESVKIGFCRQNNSTYAVFRGSKHTLVVESNYRGKHTRLSYKVRRNASFIAR